MSDSAENPNDHYEQRLLACPEGVAVIRRRVRGWLRACGREELADGVTRCPTELVGNVVKHTAEMECRLTLDNGPGGVRGSVGDDDFGLPVVKEPDHLAEGGRGLFLLGGIADAWGVCPTGSGKEVWFTMRAGEAGV